MTIFSSTNNDIHGWHDFRPYVPYDYQIVGVCSKCGGAVVVPKVWLSVLPAIPTCQKCGAMKRQETWKDGLPTIDME